VESGGDTLTSMILRIQRCVYLVTALLLYLKHLEGRSFPFFTKNTLKVVKYDFQKIKNGRNLERDIVSPYVPLRQLVL
jgi:hypothetical protein